MIREYIVLDLEMTGLSAKTDQIIEIGAIKIRDGQLVDTYHCVVDARCSVPERITQLTGITDEMVRNGVERDAAISGLLDFMEGFVLVGQNLNFDYGFLKQWAVSHKRPLEAKACDTLKIARELLPAEQSKKLTSLCEFFGIERQREHRALDDAIETQKVFEALVALAQSKAGVDVEKLFTPQPLSYRAKKQTPATMHQVQRLKEYREKHHITDVIEWENLTRSEASRIMDKYVLVHGR
jgi:DNA polymerase-3 subunit alpha (Gram-positive type)